MNFHANAGFGEHHRLFYKYVREHKGELNSFKGLSRWFARARLYAEARDYADKQLKNWRHNPYCLY